MKEAIDFITANWGDDGKKVIDTCRDFNLNMTIKEFVNKHCTACGGNWGGMFLTGIRKLAPAVYDAIPDDMGNQAFLCICYTMQLIGIDCS